MSTYSWKRIYRSGISELDDQHKKLIDILNKFSSSLSKGQEYVILESSLDDLIKYTNYHLDSEEKHLNTYNYPFIDSHLKEHSELRNKVLNLKNKLKVNNQTNLNEISEFARTLLVKHMMLNGRRYGLYFYKNINNK